MHATSLTERQTVASVRRALSIGEQALIDPGSARLPPPKRRCGAARSSASRAHAEVGRVSLALGPTRPDKLTIWPLSEDGFGIDVRWSGGDGNRRATVVRRLLSDAGIQARFSQHPDGRGWELAFR